MIIVTRHEGLIDWLAQRGITGKVISHATADDVAGKHVVGNLPLHLASLAKSVTTVDMPNLSADLRGVDLTPAQMDNAGASLVKYVVTPDDIASADPLSVGQRVLQSLGYDVTVCGFGYNSISITVKKDGDVVYQEDLGL